VEKQEGRTSDIEFSPTWGGGHDVNQVNKKMSKDSNLHNEKSSQSGELTRGRIGHRPEHLKFFLLVFLMIRKYCK